MFMLPKVGGSIPGRRFAADYRGFRRSSVLTHSEIGMPFGGDFVHAFETGLKKCLDIDLQVKYRIKTYQNAWAKNLLLFFFIPISISEIYKSNNGLDYNIIEKKKCRIDLFALCIIHFRHRRS